MTDAVRDDRRPTILPAWVDRARVLEVEWGADVRSLPARRAGATAPFARDPARIWCVFAGAFRSWHGAVHLSAALARLHAAGDHRFGARVHRRRPGARRGRARPRAACPASSFTGALPHDRLPAALAAADIGVAPFDPTRHAPLRLGFYWSPLKIFEYMAVGLPVVAPALPRLRRLVEHGREGLLYDPDDPRGARPGASRRWPIRRCGARMGAAARARVVRDFSWAGALRARSTRACARWSVA